MGGTTVSIFWRKSRAKTGDTPPEEIAIVKGALSTMAGKIKLHSVGLSTTFTQIPALLAHLLTFSLTNLSLVAEMTSLKSAKSLGSKYFR